MPKPPPAARSDQPGRRATNKLYIRFEPDVRTALAELQAQRHPASANSLVNQAVREFCARELGAREEPA